MKSLIAYFIIWVLQSCSAPASDTLDEAGNCPKSALPPISGETLPADIDTDVISIQLARAENFRRSLSCDLQAWTARYPNLYAIILNDFLDDYTATHRALAKRQIWSMTYNDNYSGDGFFADADTAAPIANDNLQLIPQKILSGNGQVSIHFGITSSDGGYARQKVSVALCQVLSDALKLANTQLPKNQLISAIEIKSTTNGNHLTDSNHSKKTAMDISQINGVPIAFSPPETIALLQTSFDAQPQIRENFGPAFKHKTSADGSRNNYFKIPGHFDHIHISVQ
ncbi:hypothetical protein HYN48_10410 [Flavobacterium magnum]|uniref:Uncharacterized protein n=1 Tax=Flavobacterium magnum TaxID=2162713 RepID=A0A2S0RFR8_9FLAO|nr:hypothetical protein [Flavobacterium magnum]AWA30465.1 hypothetical protein HYN48_10410 [Flavobacterium magnum]